MEGSEEASPWERSSASRVFASSTSRAAGEVDEGLGVQGGGFRRERRKTGEVSLRQWLDRPERAVEMLECLHVFWQVADAVSSAHFDGVVGNNVRPSCFVMSAFSRLSFVESASYSSSACDSCCDEGDGGRDGGGQLPPRLSDGNPVGDAEGLSEASCLLSGLADSTAQILPMELNWYSSPEEAAGDSGTYASDIYRLGVLLFELFCKCDSPHDKIRTMENLRHRVLPPRFLLNWPKVASFCLWLLQPRPDTRPKMGEVLQSKFFNETRDRLEECEAAIHLREEIENQELLLEFLLIARQRKQEIADKLHGTVSSLTADIKEVVKQQSVLMKKGITNSELQKVNVSTEVEEDKSLLHSGSASSGSRKRLRPRLQYYDKKEPEENFAKGPISEELEENCVEGPISDAHSETLEINLPKGHWMMRNFKNLEAAYFSARCKLMKPSTKLINRKFPLVNTIRGSVVGAEGSSVDDLTSKESQAGWINPFLEGLRKYLSFSKLRVQADLKQGDLLHSSNLVCSLDFDREKDFFATAGVNRKIKIFECDMILNDDRDIHYPVVELSSRSKLSSICWNGYIKSQIASSDIEGLVQVWDVTQRKSIVEMRGHERRVWSVDFSVADPTKLASGSDDCTVKLWNLNQGGSIGTIRTRANVCSVQFPPDSSHLLAIGSADHNVYCYDLRNPRIPWCTLVGHTKTVSYVKFVDSSALVSASTDNSLRLWDLSTRTSRVLDNSVQTFGGHTNVKNFVGLSISNGYIATGSETNEVFVYHKAFPMPVLSYKFNGEDPISDGEVDGASQFISSVCWRGQSSSLLAASSNGDIKLLEMV